MTSLFRNLLFAGLAVAALLTITGAARADHDDYWGGYWGWYDDSYSPYYRRYSSRPNYRSYGYRPNRYYDDDYYGGRYRDNYRYRDNDRYYDRYRDDGGSVRVGPLEFGWR